MARTRIEKLRMDLSACFVQQKRRDALQALELLRDEIFTARPRRISS